MAGTTSRTLHSISCCNDILVKYKTAVPRARRTCSDRDDPLSAWTSHYRLTDTKHKKVSYLVAHMLKPLVKGFLAAVLFDALILNAWANNLVVEPPAGNWNKVQELSPGASLTVVLKQGEAVQGDFVRLSAEAIFLRVDANERVISTEGVSQVIVARPGSRQRRAVMYGAIFFGVGFGLGIMGTKIAISKPSAGDFVSGGIEMGAGIGGIAAALASLHKPAPRDEVIYRAK